MEQGEEKRTNAPAKTKKNYSRDKKIAILVVISILLTTGIWLAFGGITVLENIKLLFLESNNASSTKTTENSHFLKNQRTIESKNIQQTKSESLASPPPPAEKAKDSPSGSTQGVWKAKEMTALPTSESIKTSVYSSNTNVTEREQDITKNQEEARTRVQELNYLQQKRIQLEQRKADLDIKERNLQESGADPAEQEYMDQIRNDLNQELVDLEIKTNGLENN